MKNFILTIGLAIFSTIAFSQNTVSELINKFNGSDDVKIVTISGDLLKMSSSPIDTNESKSVKNLIDQVDEMVIINTKTASKKKEIRDFVNNLVNNGNYKKNRTAGSSGKEITFYSKTKNKKIVELIMLIGKKAEDTMLISMSGKIDPETVVQLLQKTGLK